MSSLSLGDGGSSPDVPTPAADKAFRGLSRYNLPRLVGTEEREPFLQLLDQVATFDSVSSRSKKKDFLDNLESQLSGATPRAAAFEAGRCILAAAYHIMPTLSAASLANLCFLIVRAPEKSAADLHVLAERMLTDSEPEKLIRSTVKAIGLLQAVSESLSSDQRQSFIDILVLPLCHGRALDVTRELVTHLGATVLLPESRETIAWAANSQRLTEDEYRATVRAITRIVKSIHECLIREELGDTVSAASVEKSLVEAIEKQPQKLHSFSNVFFNFSRENQITNKYLLTVAEALNTGWSVESLQKSLEYFQATGRPLGQCEGLLDQKSLNLLKSISRSFASVPEGIAADWAITILRGQEILEGLCSGNPNKYRTYRALYFSLLEKASEQNLLSASYERDILLLAESGAFEKSHGKNAKVQSIWSMQRLMEDIHQDGTPLATAARIAKLSIFDGFDRLRQAKSPLFNELILCCEDPSYAANWKVLQERISTWAGLDVHAPEPMLRRAYIIGLQHHLADGTGYTSEEIFRFLNKAPVSAITALLKSPEIRSKQEMCTFLAHIGTLDIPDWRKREDMIAQYIFTSGDRVRTDLSSSYQADSLPYRRNDTRAVQATSEIVEVFMRSKELMNGFGAQTAEARRPLLHIPSLHLQFARECTMSSAAFLPGSPDQMPGPGTIFSGLNLNRLLVSTPQNIEQPFLEYKLAWPWLAQAIDELPYSKVLYLRGLIGILPPDANHYYINDTHYSLIAYNDHFHNYGGWATYLVPTELIRGFLRGKLQAINTPLSNRAELTPEDMRMFLPELMAEAAKINKPILNLRWFSNFAGLCNAFPPGSAPYHLWENQQRFATRDRAGHVHKFYYRQQDFEPRQHDFDAAFATLRHAHTQVYQLAAGCFNIHDAFRMTRAIWHKDWDSPDERLTFDDDAIEEDREPSIYEKGMPRMLRQGLEFYHARLNDSSRPAYELVDAETLDYASVPQPTFSISTENMRLRTSNGEIYPLLNARDDLRDDAIDLWNQIVIPSVTSSNKDLRFYLSGEVH